MDSGQKQEKGNQNQYTCNYARMGSWNTLILKKKIYIFGFGELLAIERASISSVQWKSAIYILYVCIYSFFHGMLMRVSKITLIAQRTQHSMRAGVALTNAADFSIAHTP